MWAMMPIFRILSSGVVRAMSSYLSVWARHWRAHTSVYPAKTRGDQDTHRVGRSRSAVIGRLSAPSMQDPLKQGPGIVGARQWRALTVRRLPPVMRESAVRFRHPVCVFLLLYRLAFALRRQDQLGGEALGHRLFLA